MKKLDDDESRTFDFIVIKPCVISTIESGFVASYIYQVLQTIQMKLVLLCVWAEPAVLGSAKTALKFIYKI